MLLSRWCCSKLIMPWHRPGPSQGQIRYRRNNFLRSVGLELLTLVGFGNAPRELPKPVIQTTISIILSRSAIHVLPIFVSITIITINLKHVYLGRTLTGSILDPAINIALLQVTAKIQELLIVASLTTIIVHTIREHMLASDGVPFGIVGGAFLFSSLSYFWSPEFWGSLQWRNTPWTKFRLYGTLVLSGFLAAAAGPSSAVLLIPRDQSFDAGGANIYLRGSAGEVWPTQLGISSDVLAPLCASPNATDYAICPSGGFLSIQGYQKTMFPLHNYIDMQQNISSFSLGPTNVLIQSTLPGMLDILLSGNWRSYACQTSMTGVHVATAIVLSRLLEDWHQTAMSIPYSPTTSSISQYKYYDSLSIQTDSRIPAVRVACSGGQNLSLADNAIRFPVMPQLGCWNSTDTFTFPALNKIPTDNIRATWVPLPNKFGIVSTGLIFEAPWTAKGDSRVVLGCSIDARWTNGTIRCQANGHCSGPSITTLGPADGNTDFRPVNDSSWSHIYLQQSWLDVLTPYKQVETTQQRPWNATTLEKILAGSDLISGLSDRLRSQTEVWNELIPGGLNRTITLEWVLSALIANGLSREGSARAFDTTAPISSWTVSNYNKTADFGDQLLNGGHPLQRPSGANLTENRVSINITGYSYRASTLTDYLSMAVLFIHMLLAITHVIELLITHRSSGCWDTVTELLALMQNSRPARSALKNTCAGIKELKTYAQVAVIRAIYPANNHETELPYIELLFREDQQSPVELQDLLEETPARSISSSHGKTSTVGSSNGYLSTTTGYGRENSQSAFHSDLRRSTVEATVELVRPNALYG